MSVRLRGPVLPLGSMLRTLIALLVAGTTVGAPGAAYAQQDPADFTPEGYEFCGWKILGEGWWSMEDPRDGAYLRGFAHGMSCRTARRHITRVRYSQTQPYRPLRPGYRCKTLDSDYEYSDVRCIRKGGKRKFRLQTGS